jgi:hypothetical protein
MHLYEEKRNYHCFVEFWTTITGANATELGKQHLAARKVVVPQLRMGMRAVCVIVDFQHPRSALYLLVRWRSL